MIVFFDLFLVLFISLAVGFDVKENRIPNWLILLAVTGGILISAWRGAAQVIDSLLGLGLGVGILLVPFALGWLGAGDVKLLGAVGSILGVRWLPRIFFYSALLGGGLAAASIAFRGTSLKSFKDAFRDLKLFTISRGAVLPAAIGEKSAQGAHTIPYGAAIGLGTLVAFYVDPTGEWIGF